MTHYATLPIVAFFLGGVKFGGMGSLYILGGGRANGGKGVGCD